ncbi:Mycobacterium terramassiliense ORFan [Mycobacterium terramassiliense]|uniref:Mycobacterium terramassiliense ORFan n=1 Tax=Mycobacterium terramassiliense TaxID=1841859 RepID=A0A2U3NJ84_9MYCO|nr:Mycobacterium terramassiliense ORFan [Mycobacterium terramassiliense]
MESRCYGSALTVDSQHGCARCPFCGDQVETICGVIVEHCPEAWTCPCGAELAGAKAMLSHMDATCREWSASGTYLCN